MLDCLRRVHFFYLVSQYSVPETKCGVGLGGAYLGSETLGWGHESGHQLCFLLWTGQLMPGSCGDTV